MRMPRITRISRITRVALTRRIARNAGIARNEGFPRSAGGPAGARVPGIALALAAMLALPALSGCIPVGGEEQRPVVIEAVPLPTVAGEFAAGRSTRDDVALAFGAPDHIETGPGGREMWVYRATRNEKVYLISVSGGKAPGSYRFSPSGRQDFGLAFDGNGRLRRVVSL
jgi:hypothetical protein